MALTFPSKPLFAIVFGRVVFRYGEHVFVLPCPDFTNRCVWIGHTITSTGLITIGTRYSSPMSQCTILTLQIDVTECREEVGSDFKMPTYPNMTAKADVP